MTRCHRRRLRIATLAIFCLLFQQLAMAAYACTMSAAAPEPVAVTADCAKMGPPQAEDNPVLCARHCAPEHATTADTAKLSVPPLAIPPLAYDLHVAVPVAHAAADAAVPLACVDPPPRLRYCTLLI
ncbi:hypothetical protein H0E84_00360 [Luteimonas sp. SJ-92]|uniref:Copper resistance protein n=1 Tax=Luteimonas salinisoli TaxID=2752307 RepID=A0A853J7Y2_9GAMM|nr:hypothetical protein [Luteimonas salinisoli]NZA24827.1 hypothetical protein [Luteimonas salinisoli]